MRIASYYKTCPANPRELGMSMNGLGARKWWETALGVAVPQAIGEAFLSSRPHNWDLSMGKVANYSILSNSSDLSYCEVFDVPERRPEGFVYGFVDDVLGREPQLDHWLQNVRPNVLFVTHDPRPEVEDLCRPYNCRRIFLGWFIEKPQPYIAEKTITAMSTGAMGYPCYPTRTKIIEYLRGLNRPDCIVAGTHDQTQYGLTDEAYYDALSRTKYYITAGTWDFEIPAKCIEVMNYGACLVCPDMPAAKWYGLEDGVNYIKLNSVDEIPGILASDRWKEIAPAGQKLVQENHTVQKRAEQIIQVFGEFR